MLNAEIKPSKIGFCVIVVSHVLTGLAIWFSEFAWYWCLGIDFLVLYSAYDLLQRHWYLGRRYLNCYEGDWFLTTRDEKKSVALIGEYYLSPWIIILHFVDARESKTILVLFFDCLEPEDWRRLKVQLKNIPQAVPE